MQAKLTCLTGSSAITQQGLNDFSCMIYRWKGMNKGYPGVIWAWQGVEAVQLYAGISVLRHPTVSNLPQMLQLSEAAQHRIYDVWRSQHCMHHAPQSLDTTKNANY